MTTRRALFASLAAAAATAAATADRGAMPPEISYIPKWDDLDADLLARAEEKWPPRSAGPRRSPQEKERARRRRSAKDERPEETRGSAKDDEKEDNYWDERGDPSADLDRMSNRAGRHSGRPRGPTVGDALVDAVAGKIAGSIAEALFDDDENGVRGSDVTAAHRGRMEEWKKRVKAADESYERVFKANKEMYERLEKKLAGQVWDAGWKEAVSRSTQESQLVSLIILICPPQTLPRFQASSSPMTRCTRNRIAPAARFAAARWRHRMRQLRCTHLTLAMQRAAQNMRRNPGERKSRG